MGNDAEPRHPGISWWLPSLSLTFLAVAYVVGVRQTDAYLGPALGPPRSWALASLLGTGLVGALLGQRALLRAARRGQLLLRAASLLSVACSASAHLWFWAFQTPGSFTFVALALPSSVGFLAGFGLGALATAGALPFRELQAIKLLLGPLVALASLGLLLGATIALSYLGLLRAAPALGMLLAALLLLTPRFSAYLADLRPPGTSPATAALAFGALAFATAQGLAPAALLSRYPAELVWASASSPELVVISAQNTFELFEDGQLRLTSADAYRYAESIVHPLLSASGSRQRVLVLGSSAGFIEREVLRYPDVREVVSVSELAPSRWSRTLWPGGDTRSALRDPRLRFKQTEVLPWLEQGRETFDRISVNLPGPSSYLEGKHYTRYFYERLKPRLAQAGALSVMASSEPAFPQTFGSIRATLAAAGIPTTSFEASVPLLGALSLLLARPPELTWTAEPLGLPADLRYVDAGVLARGFAMGARHVATGTPSTLGHQVAVELWQREQEALGH